MSIVDFMTIAGIILTIVGLFLVRRSRAAAAVPGFAGLSMLLIVGFAHFADARLFPKDFDNPEAIKALQQAPLAPVEVVNSNDWYQWRGPNRDGSANGAVVRADWQAQPPAKVWSVPCGAGYSSPVVVNGRVFLQDRQGDEERIVCYDAADGRELWAYRYTADYSGLQSHTKGPRATPTIVDGRLYAVGARGMFICLDATTPAGQAPTIFWEYPLLTMFAAPLPSWGVAGSPLIDGDNVIVQPGGRKATIAAFDRKTGKLVWTCLNESTGYCSPQVATLAGVKQIVAFTGKGLHGVDRNNGQLLWSFPWTTRFDANIGMPIVAGDHIFISSGYGGGCAAVRVRDTEGKLRVERVFERRGRLLKTHYASCLLIDGHIYGFDETRGELKCIDLRQPNEEIWSSADVRRGNLTRIGDNVLILSEEGELVLARLRPEGMTILGRMPGVLSGTECWATPAVVGSRIYLRDHESLICLDAAPK